VVIEHNLDVIRNADWLIDLGPEGGEGGGTIVAQGPPEEVARVRNSYTGQFLRRYYAEEAAAESPAPAHAVPTADTNNGSQRARVSRKKKETVQ